ncbi:MAG: glutamate--cysteine ligase [Paracoccaceae bacterium]
MPSTTPATLNALSANAATLRDLRRGIEKESLRIDPGGELAKTPHPAILGSALTHPQITTDFSEALLEFITSVSTDIDATLGQLTDIHRLVYARLDDELLWPGSMPCLLGPDEEIPVAQYGSSNVARMKALYRQGLGQRYGRRMQTISGIHYNFSVPDSLWQWLAEARDRSDNQDFRTESYFGLIRNFRRYSWLLVYLYGAAPAVCSCFLEGKNNGLQTLHKGTLYHPHGTSLRMGDLGYQSNAQSNLSICYNTLENYVRTLKSAIVTPHADYLQIPASKQLSTGLLQIENEFYSPIRPKRVAASGETALGALKRGGVEYIEVRCIDVNPETPAGITRAQIQFLDAFLLFCLLADSPICNETVYAEIGANMHKVVDRGREPGLMLSNHGNEVSLADWAQSILDGVDTTAKALDSAHDSSSYQDIVAQMRDTVREPDSTPSAKMLATLRDQNLSYFDYMMQHARATAQHYAKQPLSATELLAARKTTEESLTQQRDIESADSVDFDQYLRDYYSQYDLL